MADHGGAIRAPDLDTNNIDCYSIPDAADVIDTIEQSLELEPESESNVREDDEYEEEEGEPYEEEGETDGENEYQFQFEGEMDPLSFEEGLRSDDASGLQPYERFGRDYEALAAKKRKAAQSNESELPAKRSRQEEIDRANFEEIMESMNFRTRRKSKKAKQRGRRKGSKNRVNPEVTRKLGDATLHFMYGRYEEAICVSKEVIRLAPNLSDPYHTLALIYTELKDTKKALNFYMIAAHLSPKDASLWKLLVERSIEHGDIRQAIYWIRKALLADPDDNDLWSLSAKLYLELGEYQKAADSYKQISCLNPEDIEALREATQLYQKCGQLELAKRMLKERLRVDVANLGVVDLLSSVLMERNEYDEALKHIERTQQANDTREQILLYIKTKAGICHIHLGHLEKAEAYFTVLKASDASSHPHLIVDVADSLMTVGHYGSALKYYMMLEENSDKCNVRKGYLHLKIARCYVSLKKGPQAIEYYYKAVEKLEDSVDARLMLSSLLLEEGRDDEAIHVLSPPKELESDPDTESDTRKLWCHSGKIKLKLSQIYKSKGSVKAFVDVLFPVIRETLLLEKDRQKVRPRKRLSTSVLLERVKVLDDHQTESVFHGFRPLASSAERSKGSRAKKSLQKKAAAREAKRAAALAAGIDWKSDDSDDESPQDFREPPLPDFLKEEGHHLLIVDLCKSLSSLRRFWDALDIVKISLKLDALSVQMKEELRAIGAQLYANVADPAHGLDNMRDFVSRNPCSFFAWNCYYKGMLRNDRLSLHDKFLYRMRVNHKDSVPPILISAHQFTMISQHQAAARQYLEAFKLMPDNPLINLCTGTALINLALGHRIQNKHQALLQGLAFLYNNSCLCGDSQEALYNIARAYHHVGLVSLAATYYEKVLAIREKDYPIPYDNPDLTNEKKPGYCDIRREAAYNLHLIYKKSGAFDLSRQVLKDHLVL